MEENYRWIKVNFYGNGEEISVRQSETDRSVFFDADGHAYNIDELDFTQIPEKQSFLAEMNERMRKYDEENERTQSQFRDMLASMDAKAIADHQAEIDERSFWRKLRGDIFLSVLENCGVNVTYGYMVGTTKYVFDELYNQDQEFFNNLNNE